MRKSRQGMAIINCQIIVEVVGAHRKKSGYRQEETVVVRYMWKHQA